jgi:hypothetical protein
MEYRNDIEIRLFHLKRGGGHAVLNWLAHCAGRPVYHLNNVFSKPNKARRRRERIFRTITEASRAKDETVRTYGVALDSGLDYRELAAMPKEVLLCNIENFELEAIAGEPLLSGQASEIIGHSRKCHTGLILRDAFNTFASVRRGKRRMRKRLKTFYARHWRSYAREYLGMTHYLPEDTIRISYNRWFGDESYRREIAASFGFEYSEEGLNEVTGYGGGSSFSGQEYQNRASDMDVLNRWRHFVDDEQYRSALDDETIELSNRIFGDVTRGEITA